MAVLYYIVLWITVPLLVRALIKKINEAFMWSVIFIGVHVLYGIGTYKLCMSGWVSPSIGSRGACSHHGGVTSAVNEIGYVVLFFSSVFIFVKLILNERKIVQDTKKDEVVCKIPDLNSPPYVSKKATLQDYEKYISGWIRNGLSVDEITTHLKSKGVSVRSSDLKKYFDN